MTPTAVRPRMMDQSAWVGVLVPEPCPSSMCGELSPCVKRKLDGEVDELAALRHLAITTTVSGVWIIRHGNIFIPLHQRLSFENRY